MICVKCQRFFRVKKNGVKVEELRPRSSESKPGKPEEWAPYKLWYADLYECPGCGFETIGGFGMEPIVEHYEDRYSAVRELEPPYVQVADCGPSHAGPRPNQGPYPGTRR